TMASIDHLTQTFRERKAESEAAYAALVRDVADGRGIDPDEAQATLAAAGRTPDHLRADVAHLQRRRGWAAQLAAVPRVEADLRDVAADKAKAEAALAEAQQRFRLAMTPLLAREEVLNGQLKDAREAAGELRKSAAPRQIDAASHAAEVLARARDHGARLRTE